MRYKAACQGYLDRFQSAWRLQVFPKTEVSFIVEMEILLKSVSRSFGLHFPTSPAHRQPLK